VGRRRRVAFLGTLRAAQIGISSSSSSSRSGFTTARTEHDTKPDLFASISPMGYGGQRSPCIRKGIRWPPIPLVDRCGLWQGGLRTRRASFISALADQSWGLERVRVGTVVSSRPGIRFTRAPELACHGRTYAATLGDYHSISQFAEMKCWLASPTY